MRRQIVSVCAGLFLAGLCWLITSPAYSDDDKALKEAQAELIKLASNLEAKSFGDDAKALAKKYDITTVMPAFKLRSRKGIGVGDKAGEITPDGIEAKIIALGKAAPAKSQLDKEGKDLVKLAALTRAIAEVNEHHAPNKNKAEWAKFNQEMKKASMELLEGAKAGDGAKVKAAAVKLNNSCNECHSEFR